MSKPIISIKLSPRNYAGLVSLGNRLVANMTSNLNFVTPLPALASVQTQITGVENAIAAWGPKGNRGSHAELLNLRSQSVTLAQTLKSLSQYVQNTAQTTSGSDYVDMAAIIATSGFQLANAKTPQGVLETVRNFHRSVSPRFNPNQAKLKWEKPLNVTSKGNVKSYRLMRGTTPVFSASVQFAVTTKATFIDTNSTGVTQTWFYWVVPVNNSGDGAVSDVVAVGLLSI